MDSITVCAWQAVVVVCGIWGFGGDAARILGSALAKVLALAVICFGSLPTVFPEERVVLFFFVEDNSNFIVGSQSRLYSSYSFSTTIV